LLYWIKLVMDAMLLLSKTFRASWSIGLATALLAAVPSGHVATAENMVGGTSPAHSLDAAASEGAFRHLRALQDIASVSGGNRAAGTPGYDRSAEYVADRLKEAGYLVHFEEFEFPFFEERVPPVLLVSFPDGRREPAPADAFRTLTNSGSSNVTARLRAVNLGLAEGPPLASASSCKTTDFDEFERGSVALIRRGTCTFQTKIDNAWAAGAAAVVIMNEGTDGRTDAFSGQLRDLAPIPVVGVSYELGRSLDIAARGGATVRLDVNAVTGKRLTRNVLADTALNSDSSLIIVGAHLDSVPEGPGINDNGSGSAAVLEAALRLAQGPTEARGGVRFAFWGAEERGLIGSRHHLGSLLEEARRHIALYINLDMVGSPNFARFVQGSTANGDGLAAVVRREFLAEFREHNLSVEERAEGRFGSDVASFSQKGIPTMGLYTGAGRPKSEIQASLFGGSAGRPYDPCYHQACDTIENINRDVLEQNTRALVRALNAAAIAARAPNTPSQKAVDLPEPNL
jgi:Zn-dependent M28 family amino/carboxypeptidase